MTGQNTATQQDADDATAIDLRPDPDGIIHHLLRLGLKYDHADDPEPGASIFADWTRCIRAVVPPAQDRCTLTQTDTGITVEATLDRLAKADRIITYTTEG